MLCLLLFRSLVQLTAACIPFAIKAAASDDLRYRRSRMVYSHVERYYRPYSGNRMALEKLRKPRNDYLEPSLPGLHCRPQRAMPHISVVRSNQITLHTSDKILRFDYIVKDKMICRW